MPGIETRAPLRTETKQRVGRDAEAFAGALLELAHRRAHAGLQTVRETPAGAVERRGTSRS